MRVDVIRQPPTGPTMGGKPGPDRGRRSRPRRQILRALRDLGPQPRVTLARRLSLSPTTVTKVIARPLDEGVVSEAGVVVPGPVDRHRRRTLMAINLGWRDVAISEHVETTFGVPTVVDHSVRAWHSPRPECSTTLRA
jgi:DNA-binding transcriptional ArsR family regulator